MKQIKEWFVKVNKVLRPVTVFAIIIAMAAPLGKAAGVYAFNSLSNAVQPVTLYEDVFVMTVAVSVGLGITIFYAETVYKILKKHFQSV